MADISDFIKQTGEFLKAEMVQQAKTKVLSITSEPAVVHNEKYDTDRLHIPGKFEGKEVTFDCSKTNSRTISDTLGVDTTKWVGKQIKLETYKTKTSDGKMVDAINVTSVIV